MTRGGRLALLAPLALLAAGLLAPAAGEIQGAAAWVRVKNLLTPGSCATAGPCDLASGTTIGGSPIGGSGAPTTADYLVGTANGSLSAEIVVGTSPGGELGGTWASPTIDTGVVSFAELVAGTAADAQVDGSLESDEVTGLTDGQISDTLTASTSTTAAANDSDTSIATTAFVQQEIDDGDLLSDNCILENDSTPIPDSCVGDGTDASGAGGGNSVEVSIALSGGAGFFSTVVTGQTWVASGSEIVCSPFGTTADSLTPEAVAVGNLNVSVSDKVAGTGFTLNVYSPNGLEGTVRAHCVGV